MSLWIERAVAADTFPLRQRVLRSHETVEELSLPGDDDSDTGHFVARDDAGVVGTGSVRREAPLWAPEMSPFWRLRGMATTEYRP
ncbi:MAG: GNAT family N-acetyltransferase [Acidimicrobiales bacterium]